MRTAKERWILVQDSSSHWYVIPHERRMDWELFCDIPDDDERGWEPPAYANAVGGAPCLVTFENPIIDGKEKP